MAYPFKKISEVLAERARPRRVEGSLRRAVRGWKGLAVCALGLNFAPMAAAPQASRLPPPSSSAPFKYVGGTEKFMRGCLGQLGLTASTMVFTCPEGSIKIQYRSILLMQYRADIGRKVRRMELPWRFKPWRSGGNRNRYFTVVFRTPQGKRVVVLAISPVAMRPYLAEIDLKVGRRVQVQSHQKYN